MKKIYFLTGSQHLYGEETLKKVANDSKAIVNFLNTTNSTVEFICIDTLKTSQEILLAIKKANNDDECVGIITWMHTFSPSKMWIAGFNILNKPYLHLHTQANEKLPYDNIDMDFMNLNQSAHGDREHGFIATRMRKNRKVVVGYYKDADVINEINEWCKAAIAYDFSKNLKVARFGDNMREVAVTEGDKVEAEIKFGWSVNGYGVGDLVNYINNVAEKEIENAYKNIEKQFIINTDNIESIKEQLKYYLAMQKFFNEKDIKAFTNTFEDLHGMKQLPGLATQLLMGKGIGYGGEGDWKTAALGSVMMKFAEGKKGGTGFMEDYTYDFTKDNELVLGAHMLEVSPLFASNKPKVEVHELGIGGKESPARLVFDGVTGEGIAVTIIDLGDRFRMIVAEIELVKQPKAMPNLPVARIMWKVKPNLKTGAAAWIMAGGAHHTVVSTTLSIDNMRDLARMYDIELIVIDKNTKLELFEKELIYNDIIYKLK